MNCIEENTIVDLLDGTLSPLRIEPVREHLQACSACRGLLSELNRQQDRPSASNRTNSGGVGLPWDPPAIAPGDSVGRYIVVERLGAGGMGVVYAADDPVLARRVALKLIHAAHRSDTGGRWRERLLQEARAIARLSHPNVIAVYDVGWFGEQIHVAMELVEGASLRAWLGGRPRGWREVLPIFAAAAHGLNAAHAAGLVHRDFKPDNVLVGHDGRVRVMDFGLARWLADEGSPTPPAGAAGPDSTTAAAAIDAGRPATDRRLTISGALVGTPGYIAPEVMCGRPADSRSDQFSFCVALHEALTGHRPVWFSSSGSLAKVEPAWPGPRIPRWLRAAVRQGLHGDPLRRHPSMAALAIMLETGPRRRRVAAALLGALAAAALMVVAVIVALPDQPLVPGRGSGSGTPWAVCACDTRADGWGVRTWYWTEGGGQDHVGDGNGSKPGCGCERSFDGRRVVRIRVCAGPDRQNTRCSADFLVR
jgi:serine/threonine protein kinase